MGEYDTPEIARPPFVTLTRSFELSCAHFLPLVPQGHKCGNMHGHNYTVEITVLGPVGEDGFVVDYGVLQDLWKPFHDKYDHKTLNNLMPNPTAELLAVAIFEEYGAAMVEQGITKLHGFSFEIIRLMKVSVKEKDSTSASYSGPRGFGYGN